VKDPVCRMRVDRYATPHHTPYEGHTYYFCTAGCQAEFESNPEHYAHHAHALERSAEELRVLG